MTQRSAPVLTATLLFLDIQLVAVAFVLAYHLRIQTENPPLVAIPSFEAYLPIMAIQVVAVVGVFFFYRLYHRARAGSFVDEFYGILAGTSVGILISVAASFFLFKNNPDYPRLMVAYAWGLTILLITLGRYLHNRFRWILRSRGVAGDRVLIVGTDEVGRAIYRHILDTPGLGYRILGFVANGATPDGDEPPGEVLGTIADLSDLVVEHRPDEVIIALPQASRDEVLGIIDQCQRENVTVKVYPDVFQIITSEATVDDLGGMPLLTVRDVALRGWRLALKRAMDMVLSGVGLILLSPFLLVLAILIKLDSKGSVFYAQERMGLDAVPFKMIKLRSMREDAEADTGPVWPTADDPRRTRIGGFLRRLSLDELPQLINVLLGEMSLVGPRPERPVFVEEFGQTIPRYMARHREKAGMTGWAQVNGLRGDTSIVDRTKYDLWYVEHWSLLLDLKILVKTVVQVFRSNNAR